MRLNLRKFSRMRSDTTTRVVHRVAENGQQRRDDRQIELELQQREHADRHEHVVRQRHDRADGELPFEAEPHVDA